MRAKSGFPTLLKSQDQNSVVRHNLVTCRMRAAFGGLYSYSAYDVINMECSSLRILLAASLLPLLPIWEKSEKKSSRSEATTIPILKNSHFENKVLQEKRLLGLRIIFINFKKL